MEHELVEEKEIVKMTNEDLKEILNQLNDSEQGHAFRIILQTFWNAGFDENAARNCCCNQGVTYKPVSFNDFFQDLKKQ